MSFRVAVSALTSFVCTFCAFVDVSGQSDRFTVRDDIELVKFIDPPDWAPRAVQFSPGYKYFVVVTEKGVLARNVVEASIWVFRTQEVIESRNGQMPAAHPLLTVSAKHIPVLRGLQWMSASEFAFLERVEGKGYQLLKVNAETGVVDQISEPGQDVGEFSSFDMRNGNAVYAALSPLIQKEVEERNAPQTAKLVTGRIASVMGLISQDGSASHEAEFDWRDLWAVVHGKRFRVDTTRIQNPLHVPPNWLSNRIAISPDGNYAAIPLPVAYVPDKWREYEINKAQKTFSFKTGPQNLQVDDAALLTGQFMRIDLRDGSAEPLLDAPIGTSGGYHRPRPFAVWSDDGKRIALVNTYLPIENEHSTRFPCIAVLNVTSKEVKCVESIAADNKERRGDRFTGIGYVRFDPADSEKLIFSYDNSGDAANGTLMYRREKGGGWVHTDYAPPEAPLDVEVKQSLNDPPSLVATNRKTGRSITLLDPNAGIRKKNLGEASEYRWTDESGRNWLGGLVKPPDYLPGHPYPLVIQTHGFRKNQFVASGVDFPTALAARELAAAGIVVLQVNDQVCGIQYVGSPEEDECGRKGYESAIGKLVDDGIADPSNIGIVGFSETGSYVMKMLTKNGVSLAAATISDANVTGYLEFLGGISDRRGKDLMKNLIGSIGAPPVGNGLEKWVEESPAFNMDKVSTPVRFEAVSPGSVLWMWEPYAILQFLGKPTEMIQIDYGSHPLSNPAERLASQGGNVDWFRFWLKGEEDPDPGKADQYARWRELRKLQEQDRAKTKEQSRN